MKKRRRATGVSDDAASVWNDQSKIVSFSCASLPSSPQKTCGMKQGLTLLSRVNGLLTEGKAIISSGAGRRWDTPIYPEITPTSLEATPTLLGGL